jgi:hypothetical protein
MLVAMDISPAGPGTAPWLVVAILVAALLVLLGAALVLRRARRRPGPDQDAGPAGPLPRYADDDLPGFLESPPGAAGRPAAPAGGWPSLTGGTGAAASPHPDVDAGPSATARRRPAVVLGALAVTTLLIAVAVALATNPGRPGPGRAGGPHDRGAVGLPSPPAAPAPGDAGAGALADAAVRPGRDGGAARLEFGGLVLEQRAVGVTATYPAVEASWDGRQAVAHLRLPTFNCLTASAPEDPVAAGCVASETEYADLPSPALTVGGHDGMVRLSGRFPTYVRPNGSPPVWTGRSYEIGVRAAPVDEEPAEGWVRAEGEIRLGSGRASTLDDPDVRVLRRD